MISQHDLFANCNGKHFVGHCKKNHFIRKSFSCKKIYTNFSNEIVILKNIICFIVFKKFENIF